MQRRAFGKSQILISEIGFGAWGIGGETCGQTSYGEVSSKQALATLNEAFNKQINFFDTANVYGDGRSEELIGQAFSKKRDQVVISSKFGLLDFDRRIQLIPAEINRSVNSSLKRLRSDYIDILHVHKICPTELLQNCELRTCLEELKLSGKVRELAISLERPEQVFTPGLADIFAGIQFNFSLLDMRLIQHGFFESEALASVQLLARTPFNFGFLAKNFSKLHHFPENDHRNRWGMDQISHWVNGANDILRAAGINDIDNTSKRIELSLKFCLSFSKVSSVIAGMMSPTEVVTNTSTNRLCYFDEKQLRLLFEAFEILESNNPKNKN